ncbi:MAG: AAA family ATPase, partial [Pseudomonadales bacterium]|nr:AAA family ATPase [Pseudomonadales bacterium]
MKNTKLNFRIPLSIDQLYRSCDADQFKFKNTSELEDGNLSLGQERAIEAFDLSLGVAADGFNIYAMGIPSSEREEWVKTLLREKAKDAEVPPDWCYVNDFSQANKPKAISFPAGAGRKFCNTVKQLVEDLRHTIPAAFESSEYQGRLQSLEQEIQERQASTINKIRDGARSHDVELLATPSGFTFAPLKEGKTINSAEFKALSDEEKKDVEDRIVEQQEKLNVAVRQFPLWQRELVKKIKALGQEVTLTLVQELVQEVRELYEENSKVQAYLDAFQQDVVDNARDFIIPEEEAVSNPLISPPSFSRYKVNYFVAQSHDFGAPVIYCDNPSLANLVGRIEYKAKLGTLTTDVTLIEPGALHRASGGYLIIDAEKVLTKPFAWEALKRALKSKKVKIDTLESHYGYASASALEPEATPLNVKVVLVGDHRLYYLLSNHDQEFRELFRVGADFDDRIARTEENNLRFAGLMADIVEKDHLTPLDPKGVARVIEQGARIVGEPDKISLNSDWLRNLLIEADYHAKKDAQCVIGAECVEKALSLQLHRSDRIRERYYEQIENKTLLIDTEGSRVGQINGLAVIDLGDFAFGKPSRITARVRLGSGGVLDIERKVELGGAVHSKGVLILSSFLAARYTEDFPLSLSASLVFEQSYGGVDGDSASSTELYALLSALSGLAIRQDIAVTGSVNQFGEVQAIGGVNEKI